MLISHAVNNPLLVQRLVFVTNIDNYLNLKPVISGFLTSQLILLWKFLNKCSQHVTLVLLSYDLGCPWWFQGYYRCCQPCLSLGLWKFWVWRRKVLETQAIASHPGNTLSVWCFVASPHSRHEGLCTFLLWGPFPPLKVVPKKRSYHMLSILIMWGTTFLVPTWAV